MVGGGPAGATVATLLARRGRAVTLVERSPAWRWRACGVFSSPAAVTALRRIGLPEAALVAATRAIPAMRVEASDGTAFRLTYGDGDRLVHPAVGFERRTLDDALLDMARAAGVDVLTGTTVVGGTLGRVTFVSGHSGCSGPRNARTPPWWLARTASDRSSPA